MRIWSITKAVILGLFFASTLYLSVGLPLIFNSPDEAANFAFSKEVATDYDLVIQEPANIELHGVIQPRSVLAVSDRLLPRSFLGLPVLCGAIGIFFGVHAMLFVTPVLAVLAILAWRGVVLAVFKDERLADVAAFLLMIHPAFWYYSGRTMMHNVGFIAFLIFSMWFFAQALKNIAEKQARSVALSVLSGAAFAATIAFRASAIVWIAPIAALLFWWGRKMVNWKLCLGFMIGAALMLAPFAMLNANLYGSPFVTGYQAEGDASLTSFITETTDASAESTDHSILSSVLSLILPFGFAEKATLRHVWQYGFLLYPWMSLVFLIGFVMVLGRLKKVDQPDAWLRWASVLLALSAWLGILYGSWTFHDNPDPNIFTLGNSYVRYWLPIFLLATPFGAFAITRATQTIKRIPPAVLQASILLILSALSFQLVFFGHDGFVPTRAALLTFVEKRERILEVTEDDSVIIADRADKFLFPARKIVQPLRSDLTYAAMPTLAANGPLYYFGITLPEEDIAYLNDDKLLSMGLHIDPVETILDETLYRISPL